ncbi:MAG: hypothetical protein JNM40_12835 [Myxococcales bacterium]|nr:hypothetical protein [Myxococcales bacterium]
MTPRKTTLARLSLGLILLGGSSLALAQQPGAAVQKPEGIPTPQPLHNPNGQYPPLRQAGPAQAQPAAQPVAQPAAQPAEIGNPTAQPSEAAPADAAQAAHAEPAHAEPAHAEPAHAEPAHAEPAHAAEPSHAEPGHGTAAAHGEPGASAHGEHGAHAAGPVIENWWSWDYGPGKTHHHPPFGFALINFVVFLFILNKLAGKSFKEFLANRHLEIRKSLDRARELEKQAQAQLDEYEKKAQAAQADIDALLGSMKQQAELERQKIIAKAEAEAEKLLKDAEAQVQQTIDSAKRELERKTALLAVDLAEKLVSSRVNDLDQRNLVERFVGQVETAATASGGRS